MTTVPRFAAIVLAGVAAIASAASRAVVDATPARAQQALFTSSAVGVRVDVLITDRGKPVPNLTAGDFEVRDNGVVQTVGAVESSDVAVNAVLALDVSTSIAGQPLADLRAATRALLDGLHPVDRAALVTFSHAVAPRVALGSDFPAIDAVLRDTTPLGDTAILDGVYVALMTTQAEAGRSLLVVCTDGRDTASWLQADEVMESARRSNAVIYTVATGGARQWRVLKDLADATGGQSLEIASSKDLKGEFERILREFRSRYVLTFVPTGVVEGGFHRLDVRVRRGGVAVKARSSYIGGPLD